uniref:Protein 4 n=1 Tax=Vincetoxicum virus 1 TaxID=2977998 RepID=A0A9N6YIZ2_9RHAB|nr:TPA_asm: protein 4 [Vincetoxicum virus 1]
MNHTIQTIKQLKIEYENPRITCDSEPVYMQVANIRKSSLRTFVRVLEGYAIDAVQCWYHDYGTRFTTSCVPATIVCEGLGISLPHGITPYNITDNDYLCKDCVMRLFTTENPEQEMICFLRTRLPGVMSRPMRSFTRRRFFNLREQAFVAMSDTDSHDQNNTETETHVEEMFYD